MRDNGRRIAEGLKSLLFPRRCPVCDDIVPVGEGMVCRLCAGRIQYIGEPRCRRCGKRLREETEVFCGDCARRPHAFEAGLALYDYRSMQKSIYRFKYAGRCEYAAFYAADIYRHFRREIAAIAADAIIPVPLHRSRQRARGYNQAELVARELAVLTGIPMYPNLVKRVRKTVPQKELDAAGRQNNLKKAFHIPSDVVKLNKTILVDDIYTTGSTLDAVALELKRCGVGEVYFITLCIGEGM
ncbi:MAG: ComF family protein [Roseburia sp.]|nr:ComF family protein [Roseburia sp.]